MTTFITGKLSGLYIRFSRRLNPNAPNKPLEYIPSTTCLNTLPLNSETKDIVKRFRYS